MDSVWMEVALNLGHTPVIAPQSILANTLFFSTTDILIISSGSIGLLNGEEITILEFIKTGKSVYLQSEYNPYFTTNQAFEFIVNALDGDFLWTNTFNYDLGHVNVLSTFSNSINEVHSINYFWNSVSGTGDCNTVPFLEHGEEFHGFQFIPPNKNYGSIITTSDQDWIWERTSLPLMENIIAHLISPAAIPEENKIDLGNDTILCVGEELLLDLTEISGDIVWKDNSNMPTYTVTQEGVNWVTANLYCGLVSDTISVTMNYCNCKLYLPNVFSPDNNGVNDFFKPETNCPISKYNIIIFDRWGELMFESKDPVYEWDGTFRGKPSPSGVYSYYIEYAFNADDPVKLFGNLALVH